MDFATLDNWGFSRISKTMILSSIKNDQYDRDATRWLYKKYLFIECVQFTVNLFDFCLFRFTFSKTSCLKSNHGVRLAGWFELGFI